MRHVRLCLREILSRHAHPAQRSDIGTHGFRPPPHEEEAAYEQELIRNLGDQALFGHPVLRELRG